MESTKYQQNHFQTIYCIIISSKKTKTVFRYKVPGSSAGGQLPPLSPGRSAPAYGLNEVLIFSCNSLQVIKLNFL